MNESIFSRNRDLKILRIPQDGEIRESYELRLFKLKNPPEGALVHTVKEGETIDSISFQYYKTEKLWWKILDYNPLIMPLELKPGQKIIVPPFSEATRAVRKREFK